MTDTLVKPEDFQRLEQIEASSSVSMLLWGAAGTGKTEFAGSFGSRTLYIDIGKSTTTFHSTGFLSRYPRANPIVVTFEEETSGDKYFPDSPNAFDRVSDTIDYAIEHFNDKFDLIVVDDVTVLREFAMNKGMKLAAQYRGSPGFANSKREDVTLSEMGDYPFEMTLIKKFCKGTIDICKANKKHFILIAHERNIYGKAKKQGDEAPLLKTLPAFSGKTFPDDILGYFDCIWHTYTINAGDNTAFRIHTVGSDMLRAKTRWGGVFADEEKNLNFASCVERIRAAAQKGKLIIAANATATQTI